MKQRWKKSVGQARQTRAAAAAPHNAPEKLVEIEKPIYGGAFLARLENKAVFVPLTLPGETARVRIIEDKRSYSTAELDALVTAAPERVVPACRHFGVCGGCQYQHAGYDAQVRMKQTILRETLERGGVRAPGEIQVIAAATEEQAWGYRNRIRLAFDAQGNLGYRGRRSNAVVAIEECPIAAPLLMKAAQSLTELARRRESLRATEVQLFCDAAEQELLVSIFASGAKKDDLDNFAQELARRIPALKGMELVAAEDRPPMQGGQAVARWGETSLTYRAAGFGYRVDHGAFFQVNRWLVDALVEAVTSGRNGDVAWDLFAGVGLFARKLAESFKQVVAVESAPQATPALEANLHGTSALALRATTLEFLRKAGRAERPDVIVVDPPRTGLGTEITTLLAKIDAPEVTYVSCDPATLARDLRALIAAGYAIEGVTLADLFPQTFHLESVVRLRRS